MKTNRSSTLIGLGLLALSIGLFNAGVANAQGTNVNVINAHKDHWDLTKTVKSDDLGGFAGVLLAKAPDNQAIVITDVVMTHNVNTTTGTFRANIRRGPASNPTDCETAGLILGPYVSPDETVSINLTTGLQLLPGEQLCAVIGGAGAGEGVTFSFSGYQTNPNAGP